MSVHKIRTRAAIAGGVTIGAGGDAGLERGAANFVRPQTGDYLGVNAGTTAVGTINLGTANAGAIRVGYSGGTAQIGFIVNGSCFVFEGGAGTAVTARGNPAGA